MWRFVGRRAVFTIGIAAAVVSCTVAAIIASERRSYQTLVKLAEDLKFSEARNPRRYTKAEIRKVVGGAHPREWTDAQTANLSRMYNDRCTRVQNHWDEQNAKLAAEKKAHPEKYHGLLGLVAYGRPDIFSTGHEGEDQQGKVYDAYKCLEEEE